LFTAAKPDYGGKVVKLLDPEGRYFSKVIYRSGCLQTNGKLLTKDLRAMGGCLPLTNTVIVDNSVGNFVNQLGNGIPIIPYFGDDLEDYELPKLLDYLIWLKKCPGGMAKRNKGYLKLSKLGDSGASVIDSYLMYSKWATKRLSKDVIGN